MTVVVDQPGVRPMLVRIHRMTMVLLLGFASGLPLALTGGAMQAWLTLEGLDLVTLGFLALIGVPYTFKFLWAPLIDRFELPLFGRRRGWIVVIQLAIAGALMWMASISPGKATVMFAVVAVLVAFLSASLDIVIDAYRTDLLAPSERGLGGSLSVLGYRLAMVLSGGIVLVWADQWGSWPQVYRVMAGLMTVSAVVSLLALPVLRNTAKPLASAPGRELLGFAGLIVGVAIGAYAARWLLMLVGFDADSQDRWARLAFLIMQIVAAMGLGLWMARRLGFETLNRSLQSYFQMPGAWAFLALVVLYKVGDAFALSLSTPFLIKGVGFSQTEVGLANKSVGLLMTIAGAIFGGFVLLRVRLSRALLGFGVLQLVSNLGYYALAVLGAGAYGSFLLPAFDLFVVSVPEPTPMDTLLLVALSLDNFAGGMGTAAFVALLMSLCGARFSATHYALLSAFASLGRVFIGPLAGVLAEQYGWPTFYLVSLAAGVPGLWLAFRLRAAVDDTQTVRPDAAATAPA
ncbi:AmpG family muropeptide MFS transporter [Montanilutibacter psychrotolerans]|uniref:MFS transporter n=1 Tax=Montanilutibacter psychrotolerans TaxID=1327343 RepID=A0A3M8SYD8_9GAMM|nr:MFS transporter [Lysobacter psychrotolerans]RNF83890.1 MFS transporter [Lysobacter psychrotolerans]